MKKPERRIGARKKDRPMKLEGGCACGAVRYTLTAPPLIVHACHCPDCQRITGGAFVINVWIESQYVEGDRTRLKSYTLKAGSGKKHQVFFCPTCGTYLWSRYGIVPSDCLFVRAGTLDTPSAVKPDVHIFTRSKVPWLKLPDDAHKFEAAYQLARVWPADKLERIGRNVPAPA
jgi:hypothetical protein